MKEYMDEQKNYLLNEYGYSRESGFKMANVKVKQTEHNRLHKDCY